MDELFQGFGSGRALGIEHMVLAFLLAFILASAISAVYRWTYLGLSYSRSFVHTLVLASIVSSIMIMAIGNNIARGLGILGTLAIIRFRTPIRDPRDIIFLFAAIAIGIASGATVFVVAIVGTICFCAAALYLHWSPATARRQHEGLLRFMLPPRSPTEKAVQQVMNEYCSTSVLVAMREAVQGDLIEFSYQVRLHEPTVQSDFMDALRQLEGVTEVSLFMQRFTVEI